jgi:parallel beta-helix repeat protein
MRSKTRFLRLERLETRTLPSNYVVSPQGDDHNPGTEQQPWLTLQHAANSVFAGDTVDVLAGDYKGFDLEHSGSAGNPIIFHAEPGVNIVEPEARRWGVGDGRYGDGINVENFSNISWIVIDGFHVARMPEAGIRVVGDSRDHADFVTVTNNSCDANGRWGIFTGYADHLDIENNVCTNSVQEHGIYVSNSPLAPTIRNNIAFGNNACGIQINADGGVCDGALIDKNILHDNGYWYGNGGGAAINLDGVINSRIQNNLLYNNHGSGIVLYVYNGAQPSHDNVVVNNTVVQATNGRYDLLISDRSINNKVFNNIFTGLGRGTITITSDSLPGFQCDFNVVGTHFEIDGSGKTFDQWQSSTGEDLDSFMASVNDLFVDPAGGDYHLNSNSPAIGGGQASFAGVDAPTDDLDGNSRSNYGRWDLGCYES